MKENQQRNSLNEISWKGLNKNIGQHITYGG